MVKRTGIGIDLGGTFIKYALGDEDGTILKKGKRPTDSKAKNNIILDHISEAISEMQAYAKLNGLRPRVVGVGTPGCVDVQRGILRGGTPNFLHWIKVPIAEELKKRNHLPVFVDNDANLMALAEAKFGAGKGHKNVICLTIGTGIGGGIIVNNELYRGSNYAGAEPGHMSIKHDGRRCRCGGKGCLELYASATAMIAHFAKISKKAGLTVEKDINVKRIFELFAAENRQAAETIELSTNYLGRGIANLMNIFNPTRIIIGGGVAGAGEVYLKRVKNAAFTYAMAQACTGTNIVGARLGNSAGYLGAIGFAFHQLDNQSPLKE
jgi:glucokinase